MKQLFKPLDYFFVLRPTLFYPVWTVFLAGFFVQSKYGMAATNSASNHQFLDTNGIAFIWVGLFLTMLMGAVFILNQIMDRKTDNKNHKLFLIAHGHLTPKAAFIESAVLIVIAVIFAFIFSIKMGVLFLGILILTGWLYSFEPFKFKDRPLLGLVAAWSLFNFFWWLDNKRRSYSGIGHLFDSICLLRCSCLFINNFARRRRRCLCSETNFWRQIWV